MAIQFFDEPGAGTLLGRALGKGASAGLSQALNVYAKQKLANMMEQQKSSKYKEAIMPLFKSFGASPEAADQAATALAGMSERERISVMSNPVALEALLSGGGMAPQGASQAMQPFSQPESLSGSVGQQGRSPFEALQGGAGLEPYSTDQLSLYPGMQEEQQAEFQQAPPQRPDFFNRVAEGFKSPQQRMQEQALLLKQAGLQEKREAREDVKREKREFAYREDLNKALNKAERADEQLRTLDQMTSLAESGKLNHPAFVKLLQKTGQEWLLSPESQTFKSLSKTFFKSLKDLFGARPLGIEFEAFKEQFPSLLQTDEGKKMVADTLKYQLQQEKLDAQAMKNVLKSSRNLSPLDFSTKVSEEKERLKKDFTASRKKKANARREFEEMAKKVGPLAVGVWDEEAGKGTFYRKKGM